MIASTGTTLQGLGTFITAMIAASATIGSWIGTHRKLKAAQRERKAVLEKVEEVKAEVVTGNQITLGQKADADETRRIENTPHDERTAKEQDHLDAAPPDDRPQGPGPLR